MDELAADLCAGAARIAAATAEWLVMLAEFDQREGWAHPGLLSCAHWLSWRCGLAPGAAREHVRVARALTGLPSVTAAFQAGRLSFSKVRALTRVAEPDTEANLLGIGLNGTAAHVEKVVRGWRRADRLAEPPEQQKCSLDWHWDADGTLRISGRLAPEEGAMLLAALEAFRERPRPEEAESKPAAAATDSFTRPGHNDVPTRPQHPSQRQTAAEALVEVARAAMDPDPDRRGAAARHQVVLHLDADVLADDTSAGAAHLDGGPALSPEQARRIACESSPVVMLRRGREVLDVGRSTRTIPAAILRALWARDAGCRFPGCQETARSRVQGHHVAFWTRGGTTALDNLVLLCRAHHWQIHHTALTVWMDSRGQPVFGNAAGGVIDEHAPQPVAAPADLVGVRGSLTPSLWAGEKLDLHYAIGVLLTDRARRRRDNRGRPLAA